MSLVTIQGNASGTGTLTIAAPNTNSNYTLTLPTATTTLVGTDATQTLTNKTLTSPTMTGAIVSSMASSVITSGTAVASTSGTSIDFTGIPSWVKRITVMLNGVSTSGTSAFLVQLGDSGGIENTGYTGIAVRPGSSTNAYELSTAGFPLNEVGSAASTYQSLATLALLNASTNTWVISGTTSTYVINNLAAFSGGKSLSATLTQVRITTVNGTDTFDAGSINILYE